jgi:hypothetical protein
MRKNNKTKYPVDLQNALISSHVIFSHNQILLYYIYKLFFTLKGEKEVPKKS